MPRRKAGWPARLFVSPRILFTTCQPEQDLCPIFVTGREQRSALRCICAAKVPVHLIIATIALTFTMGCDRYSSLRCIRSVREDRGHHSASWEQDGGFR